MASKLTSSTALLCLISSVLASTTTSCDPTSFNTTITQCPITTEGTTLFDIAEATNRGVCDIGSQNLVADVIFVPNVGQTILIPPQVCSPDSTTCILSNATRIRTCINGGPRLYYTVNGDTYDVITNRLNTSTDALLGTTGNLSADDTGLTVGQFVKVPLCDPSQCIMKPYEMTDPVLYVDLAAEYGTTVGQIMMLSPTYNYSQSLLTGTKEPAIVLPINCTESSGKFTVIT